MSSPLSLVGTDSLDGKANFTDLRCKVGGIVHSLQSPAPTRRQDGSHTWGFWLCRAEAKIRGLCAVLGFEQRTNGKILLLTQFERQSGAFEQRMNGRNSGGSDIAEAEKVSVWFAGGISVTQLAGSVLRCFVVIEPDGPKGDVE